ncbi:hypothetical protein MATL_G00253330 [Megalops atlanticus]|uniref:FISNA domain-containing protein n=1 Tax=Megalops atlanticus TaxID=7932 RepID=A0A9D3P9S3_MEGAT|nr:hypothetical protein MATL_G00253330 [Megalops atlanticus]
MTNYTERIGESRLLPPDSRKDLLTMDSPPETLSSDPPTAPEPPEREQAQDCPLRCSGGEFGSYSKVQRAESPAFSCISVQSDRSMDQPVQFSKGDTTRNPKVQRAESPALSCLSMQSDRSMDQPVQFREGDIPGDPKSRVQRAESPALSCLSMQSNRSMDQPVQFSSGFVAGSSESLVSPNIHTTEKCVDYKQDTDTRQNEQLQTAQEAIKAKMKTRFQIISEVIAKQGNPTLLNSIYTELYITEGDSEGVNTEHETNLKNQKYQVRKETTPQDLLQSEREMILKLGELAFQHLENGNLIFYEEDLRKVGIDVNAASVYSGLCTEIFKEESFSEMCQGRVFSFIHLSIQEYLAALYVFVSYRTGKTNLLDQRPSEKANRHSLFDLHKMAVDQASQSQSGHLDLFLRFLLGLSLGSNQTLLQGLTQTGSIFGTVTSLFHSLLFQRQSNLQETLRYIKEKIKKDLSPERTINLFHCLNELNDHTLVKEVQGFLSSGGIGRRALTPTQLSALVFVLLKSEEDLDEFDLGKYSRSEEGLLRMLPVVKFSRRAL